VTEGPRFQIVPDAPEAAAEPTIDELAQQAEPVQPWPDPVDGATLLDNLRAYFTGPLVLPEGGPETCALYAATTHIIDLLEIVPYINFRSEAKRAGKSIGGTLMSHVVRRPRHTANASPAWIFRQEGFPTLIIDEGDTFIDLSDELRGILNAGYDRNLVVGRVAQQGRNFVPVEFRPFGFKVICGIGNLPDTVTDRSLVLDLRRKKRTDQVTRFNRQERLRYKARGTDLNRQLLRWTGDNWERLDAAVPVVPAELHDRAQHNWEPLLVVADVAGGHWPETARRVAKLLSAESVAKDDLEVLLADIYVMLAENRAYQHVDVHGTIHWLPGHVLTPTELARRLWALEERPWSAYGPRQLPITTDQVGKMLSRAGIRSQKARFGNLTPRVLWRELLYDAWQRYEICDTCEWQAPAG